MSDYSTMLVRAIPMEVLARFKIPEKFLPVAGTESSRNRNANQNFDFVPVMTFPEFSCVTDDYQRSLMLSN
jgi:hypothetical protein